MSDYPYDGWKVIGGGAAHYYVIKDEKVVQEIVAMTAKDAREAQVEEGLLYAQVAYQLEDPPSLEELYENPQP